MPPARPSTRAPSCWAWPIRAGRSWPSWRARPATRLRLPRPMLDRPGFEFSFSGLKTAVALAARAQPLDAAAARRHRPRRAGCDHRDPVHARALRAIEDTGHRQLVVAGGVGANRELRARLASAHGGARRPGFLSAQPEFCTDNAAMIAVAGLLRLQAGERSGADIGGARALAADRAASAAPLIAAAAHGGAGATWTRTAKIGSSCAGSNAIASSASSTGSGAWRRRSCSISNSRPIARVRPERCGRRHGRLQGGRQARAGLRRRVAVPTARDPRAPPGAAAAHGILARLGAHRA